MINLPECEEFRSIHQDVVMKSFQLSSVPESLKKMNNGRVILPVNECNRHSFSIAQFLIQIISSLFN